MEENKFLPPKFSFACEDLAKHYQVINHSGDISTMSKTSSDISLVSVPGMRDTQPLSPHSQMELQTIKETQEKKKKGVISTPKTFNNSCKYSLHSGKNSKCSSRKNSIIFSQGKPNPIRKNPYQPNGFEKYINSQRNLSNSPNTSVDAPISFDKRENPGRYSSNPRKRVFKVVKSHERTEINVSVKSSKQDNITFCNDIYTSYQKQRKQRKKLPQITRFKSQNNSPTISQNSKRQTKISSEIGREATNVMTYKVGSMSGSQHKKILEHLSSKHGFQLLDIKKSAPKRTEKIAKSESKKVSPRNISKHQTSVSRSKNSK